MAAQFYFNCKRQKSEGDELSYLPEDAIVEILVRLPVKSILKFKATCKNWYYLLQSRPFIEFHRRHHLRDNDHGNELFFSRNPIDRLLYATNDEPYVISCLSYSSKTGLERHSKKLFDFQCLRQALMGERLEPPLVKALDMVSPISMLGPLNNGISCVIAQQFVTDTVSSLTYSHCKIAICNLATRKFNLVCDPFPLHMRHYRARLTFDYHQSYGFCSINNSDGVALDYKIVAIQQDRRDKSSVASVYSQKRGSWDRICDPSNMEKSKFVSGLIDRHGKVQFPEITQKLSYLPAQALLNGYCHWLAQKQRCVLRFNMANEIFETIAAPPSDDYNYSNFAESEYNVRSGVFVLENHLAAFIEVEGREDLGLFVDHIDVWMRMEYRADASWTKIYSCKFNLCGRLARFLGLSFSRTTTGDTHSSITIDKMFFIRYRAKKGKMESTLVSCDSSGFEEHRIYKHYWVHWKPLGLSPYVETLEPVS